MAILQSGLYESIEQKNCNLKKSQNEVNSYKQQLQSFKNENEALRRILQDKDKEISIQKSEIDQLNRDKDANSRNLEKAKKQIKKNEDLIEEIEKLKSINHNIKSKLNSSDALHDANKVIGSYQNQLREREDQINDLEKERLILLKEIDRIKNKKPRNSNKPDREDLYLEDTQRKERDLTQPLTDRARVTTSYKDLCKDMMKILGASRRKDLFSKVLHLQQFHEKFKKQRNLLSNISHLIVDCSPPNTFETSPNTHQI